MGRSFDCELRLTSINQDVRRGRCCPCVQQWLRHVQGRLRRRRRPQGRLPLHRWPSPPPGCHGRYGTEGRLRRRRGPVQEGYPHPEVPRRARNHHQLGRHGEDLAPHLLQRAPRCPRGAARPPDRGPPQPQGQQGEDDPDHVRDLQHARHVRRHPGCALPVRLRPYHWYRHGLRAVDVHRCRLHLPREVLRTSRRPGHHHRQRTFPLPRGPLPAFLPRNGSLWHPRDHLQLHHEVRRGHQEGPVRQHRHVRGHHHVPRYCRSYAEGDHRPRSLHHQDQDHRSSREEVLRLDRRIHPGFPVHLPADVDHQAGVRRVRPIHCPPQVLLNYEVLLTTNIVIINNIPYILTVNNQNFIIIYAIGKLK